MCPRYMYDINYQNTSILQQLPENAYEPFSPYNPTFYESPSPLNSYSGFVSGGGGERETEREKGMQGDLQIN